MAPLLSWSVPSTPASEMEEIVSAEISAHFPGYHPVLLDLEVWQHGALGQVSQVSPGMAYTLVPAPPLASGPRGAVAWTSAWDHLW